MEFKYRGLTAEVSFDPIVKVYYGEIADILPPIIFQASDRSGAFVAMKFAVDAATSNIDSSCLQH